VTVLALSPNPGGSNWNSKPSSINSLEEMCSVSCHTNERGHDHDLLNNDEANW
jgi:hypothetical protein